MSMVILFDVMDTLVVDPFFEGLEAFFGLSFRAMVRAVQPGSWVRFERGEIDEETYLQTMFRDRREVDREALHACLRQGYRYVEGMDALLDELVAARVPMHALSNYPTWHALVDEKLTLSARVPWTFVSHKTGLRKPDAEAFLGAAHTLGLPPQRCLLIDDREENCVAARALGMPAVRFENAATTRMALVDLGLLNTGES